MTADETGPEAQRAPGKGATPAAKAYERRSRRETAVASSRLTRTGSPIAAALSRVPFVATIILLLAGGIVGVLWLNTMSDATGLQATASRIRQASIETDVQALQKDVNTLQDPARLAAAAQQLGLVRAGDSALLQIGADGKATVIGTPTPVPGEALPAPTGLAAPAVATTPTTTIPAATTLAATTPAATTPATTPVTTAVAGQTMPAATTTVATTAATTTAATTGVARTVAPTTPAAKSTPAKSTPAKSTPASTTPANASAVKTASTAKTAPAKTTAITTTAATAAKTLAANTKTANTAAKTTAATTTAPAQTATTTTGAGR